MSANNSVEDVSTSVNCNGTLAKSENTLSSQINHTNEKMNEGESSNTTNTTNITNTTDKYNIETILNTKGYKIMDKLTKTSQGAIYKALDTNTLNTVIIKIASKDLVNNGIGKLSSNVTIKLQENILNEVAMLKQITIQSNKLNIASSFVKYIDFFNDTRNYFFIMSYGGQSLESFVDKCHQLIFDETLDLKEWIIIVQLIFKQIINIMHILHNKHMICHLDICPNNILIKNAKIVKEQNGNIKISKDFEIVLCDFGLAESFKWQKNFECSKFVGKRRYISPEAFNKLKPFDATLNDIWSIGVCLFKMCVGWNPYNTPNSFDYQFNLIKNGKVEQLLQMMNKECFVTNDILDLLKKIFTNEKNRITLKDIQNHSFLRI